tara:strand:+ start:655 stop:1092 length:438 start_codon:yes stop_codon:yes gene_type:complete
MLGDFQKKIVNVLGILLVICLVIFFTLIFYINREQKFPPVIGDCPDYWISSNYFKNKDKFNMLDDLSIKNGLEETLNKDEKDNKSKCVNIKKLGNPNCSKIMDFNEIPYNTKNGLCAKYKWAKDCDLTWDGITNNKRICNKNNKN